MKRDIFKNGKVVGFEMVDDIIVKTHEARLTAHQWISLLSDSEETAQDASTDQPVKRAMSRLRMSSGAVMGVTDRPIIRWLNAIENDAIIDATRKAELRLGKPI